MLKILIISLHYPPDNIIAARRSEAYARHFYKFGIYPTIITDRYEKEYDMEGNWTGYKNHTRTEQPVTEEYETHCVIRLPRYINPLQQFQKFIEGIPLLSPLFTLLIYALGHFDMHLLGHYSNYKRYLIRQLKTNTYDLILTIDGPHYHLRLASKLNIRFGIPYVCDFRDLYDINLLSKGYSPSILKRVINCFKKYYLTKWLLKSRFVTSVSKPYAEFFSQLSGKNGFEITNGYEPDEFINIEKEPGKEFQVLHLGTLYPSQDLNIFISGVEKFIAEKKPEDFKVAFVGTKKFNKAQISELKARIDETCLRISGRVERSEALSMLINSDILLYPAWPNYTGIFSGKIFEYLGARRPILFAPGDEGGVVDQLLAQTGAGISANTPEEVCSFITEKYNEWKQTGQVSYQGKEEEIIKYTRENQVRKMAELIRGAVENGG